MQLHLFHITPTGVIRAFNQLRAGWSLCRRHGVRFRDYVPASVNSMTAAWNFQLTLDAGGLPRPKTILDIGANNSQMTKLLMLACERSVGVHSFEPHPGLNPIGTKHSLALSDRNGETEFFIPSGDHDWGTIKRPSGQSMESFKVNMARFDTLVEEGKINWSALPGPVLVKVDTEGSEFDAIRGFGNHLANVDYLLVEVENHEVRGGNYSMAELSTYLSAFGFNRSKVLYACYDGPVSPAYLDTMFWRDQASSRRD